MKTAMQEPEDRSGLMEFSYHEFYHLFTPALGKVFCGKRPEWLMGYIMFEQKAVQV